VLKPKIVVKPAIISVLSTNNWQSNRCTDFELRLSLFRLCATWNIIARDLLSIFMCHVEQLLSKYKNKT
jgi:hypothetical protein